MLLRENLKHDLMHIATFCNGSDGSKEAITLFEATEVLHSVLKYTENPCDESTVMSLKGALKKSLILGDSKTEKGMPTYLSLFSKCMAELFNAVIFPACDDFYPKDKKNKENRSATPLPIPVPGQLPLKAPTATPPSVPEDEDEIIWVEDSPSLLPPPSVPLAKIPVPQPARKQPPKFNRALDFIRKPRAPSHYEPPRKRTKRSCGTQTGGMILVRFKDEEGAAEPPDVQRVTKNDGTADVGVSTILAPKIVMDIAQTLAWSKELKKAQDKKDRGK